MKETYRLLKSGGRLVIADGLAKRREFTEKEWKTIVTCLNGWSVPNLATPDKMKSYFKNTGFTNIIYQDISDYTLPSAKHMHRTALISSRL